MSFIITQQIELEIAYSQTVKQKNIMLPFQNPAYRLSGKEIFDILKNCRLCFKITNKGQQIVNFKLLPLMKVPKQKKNAIILHAYEHWMLILIFKSDCILCDPLNTIQFAHPDVLQAVVTFCKNNSLYLHIFGVTYQSQFSNVCGWLILWTLLKATKLSFSGFMKLKKTILANNISTNERGMIHKVKQHFNI